MRRVAIAIVVFSLAVTGLTACGGDGGESDAESRAEESQDELEAFYEERLGGDGGDLAGTAGLALGSLPLSCTNGQIGQARAWAGKIIKAAETAPTAEFDGKTTVEILDEAVSEAVKFCPVEIIGQLKAADSALGSE